jgi:hypothetical protein
MLYLTPENMKKHLKQYLKFHDIVPGYDMDVYSGGGLSPTVFTAAGLDKLFYEALMRMYHRTDDWRLSEEEIGSYDPAPGEPKFHDFFDEIEGGAIEGGVNVSDKKWPKGKGFKPGDKVLVINARSRFSAGLEPRTSVIVESWQDQSVVEGDGIPFEFVDNEFLEKR